MTTVLRFEDVSYTYPGAVRPSLRSCSLAIEPGEFCLVAGLSASGKSTLLRAANGLVPHFHGGEFGGRVTVGGLDTRECDPARISAVAGSLFQDPETQVVLNTVRAELAFPLENRGHGAAAVARGVEEAALALGIESLLDRSTHELSGGELQRVALGAALAGRPSLVLLDEPTSQLDPVAGDELVWLLRRLNEEWGTAVVLSEHRLERCLAAADRVIAMRDGTIACDAPPSEFLEWAAEAEPPLLTPGAQLFRRAGLSPPPVGVKEARAALRSRGLLGDAPADPVSPSPPRRRRRSDRPVLRMRDVWHELREGRAILRAVDLEVDGGERIALMGRNGAGKSTLLRHVNGLMEPTRGRVEATGRVALLLQNPGDYVLHDRVADEAGAEALALVGLDGLEERNPRDLSGGERQRLALAIVLGAGERPAVVCLDEPTRGMDRAAKATLAERLRALAGRRQRGGGGDARRGVRGVVRRPRGTDGRRPADRGRLGRRGARRRLVLRDGDGADPRRRGRRPAARRGRRAAAARGGGGVTVSWQVASYAILFAALAAGFGWYERSHPSSKVLALVATLAALAAISRIAFAPLPNVKPMTDIVLLSGFALGGAPGFAVGAVAALASNLVFGQGPWTPWQMGAWGAVGVMGALLGAASGRRLGRWPLAIACLVAGFAYGAVLDFSVWVTFAGEQTLAQYLTISGASFGFNVAHAVGNLVFCLAFGPAFVHALLRFRARFEITWRPAPVPAGAAAALVAVLLAAGALVTAAPERARASAHVSASAEARVVAYLRRAQNRDGGFGPAPGARSTQSHTAWTTVGFAASGLRPARVRRGGRSPLAFITRGIRSLRDPGDIERTILALVAAGADPRRQGGRNLVGVLRAAQRRDGSVSGLVNQTAFAILSLRAAGSSTRDGDVRRAASWVARQANGDGGFNYARRGAASGIDDTAGAVMGLVSAGRRGDRVVSRAIRFLERRQNPDGGFPLTRNGPSNAPSTAWAIQALVAARRNPDRVRRGGSRTPVAFLRSLVAADGSVRYSRTSRQSPVWVTAQALTGLARRPFPIAEPR